MEKEIWETLFACYGRQVLVIQNNDPVRRLEICYGKWEKTCTSSIEESEELIAYSTQEEQIMKQMKTESGSVVEGRFLPE